MNHAEKNDFFELLRIAFGVPAQEFDSAQWQYLHSESLKQQIAGIIYRGICRLPCGKQPPKMLMFQWASEVEAIKGHNKLLNAEAARLTELFMAQGRKTAVLKGSANARLYPDPYMRNAGDIDLWVDGGRDSVLELLKKMGYEISAEHLKVDHHVHLDGKSGIVVEIHYKPSSGNWNPFSNARLMRYLEKEIQNVERVPEGFCVPSMKFALVMQLSHIQHHFLWEGIGLKQVVDYFVLLKQASEEDRRDVSALLSSLGLSKMGGALMWIMEYIWGLAPSQMICKPDAKNGQKVLSMIQSEGNFGRHCESNKGNHFFILWLKRRWRMIRMFWFAPVDVVCCELAYWKTFFKFIPLRIKMRRVSLRGVI